ncbi:MAG TPA: class I SAM-dependent methyltransferase [Terrimicrobiaceae bacterium]
MSEPTPTSYDGVPYIGHAYPQSYPDRLAVIGSLFGLQPTDVKRCRVLEVACGDGGNLIPLAFSLPESTFTGIDLAASAIARGMQTVSALKLSNISLFQIDLSSLSKAFGQFDYIIAHGVYSWVAPDVRNKILEICKNHLLPNGIAYVSYNAYPGGHIRDMVSEMMKFHVRRCFEPEQKVKQSRAFLRFLIDANSTAENPYGNLIQKELDRLVACDDSIVYHDDLSNFRQPVYFYQFIESAAQQGLQFLAEADFSEMQTEIYPATVVETLDRLRDDILLKEQYLDFLKWRSFRQTLLVHTGIAVRRTPDAAAILHFHIASQAKPVSPQPDFSPGTIEEFRAPRKGAVKTDHELGKAALTYLAQTWPSASTFETLRAEASAMAAQSGEPQASNSQELCEILLQLYAGGLLELHVHTPSFVTYISDRPVASPLARLQVLTGNIVTALNYASIKLEDSLSRNLVQLLDGTRDRAAIKRDLKQLVTAGRATVLVKGSSVEDASVALEIISSQLDLCLKKFASFPLLLE